jgi:hypothetical protein
MLPLFQHRLLRTPLRINLRSDELLHAPVCVGSGYMQLRLPCTNIQSSTEYSCLQDIHATASTSPMSFTPATPPALPVTYVTPDSKVVLTLAGTTEAF